MKTEKTREGYLMIDHRFSPGIDPEILRKAGIVNAPDLREGKLVEMATITCAHCGGAFVKNPLRTRDRGHCVKCHKFLCDGCAAALKLTSECRPFVAYAEATIGSDKPVPVSVLPPQLSLTPQALLRS